MAGFAGPLLGMLALGAAGGAANAITEQTLRRQKQTSDMVKTMLMTGIQQGDVGFVDDPNVQKLMTGAGFPKETPQIAKLVAQAAQPAIQAERQLQQLQIRSVQQQIGAGERAERQAAITERAQQYTPGVIAPRTDVGEAVPQRGAEGAAVGAQQEPVMRPATTTEIRRSIASLGVDAATQRAILADPLVQAEFSEALQRDLKAADKAVQLSIADARNQATITAALIRSGGKTKDDILKDLPMSVRAEMIALSDEDKKAGGTGDMKPEWVNTAIANSYGRRMSYMNKVIQQRANVAFEFAKQRADLTLAMSSARTFISKYSKDATTLNELQAHGKHFRDLMREFSDMIRKSNIPLKDKTNLLQMPIAEAARRTQWAKLGELTTLIETYRAPLAILESRLAFGLGARNPQETREKVEASLPRIDDRPDIIIGKMSRMDQAIGRIGQALNDERRRARQMLIEVNPRSNMIKMFDRGEYQVLDDAMKNFGDSMERATSQQQPEQFQILGVTEE